MIEILSVLKREFIYVSSYFMIQLRQILPYWIMGMVLGSVISVFVKDKIHGAVTKLGEHKLGVFGIVIASILGIASPALHVWHNPACGIVFAQGHPG